MVTALESPAMAQRLNRVKMRELRDAAGMTQADAATRAGFKGASQWADIENGRKANVTIETLSTIATALACDARDLILPPEVPKRAKRPKAKR